MIRFTASTAILILFASFVFEVSARAENFSVEACRDQHAITKEVIELELSGVRWQGGDSSCLKQSHFEKVVAVKAHVGDPYLLDPELILPKGRDVKILSERWLDIGGVEVKFAYIGKKDGKDVPIEDQIVYIMNYGKNRKARGCATISEEPRHFVMRAECVND